jgi:tetratricopeptide (TPR) repeat protein
MPKRKSSKPKKQPDQLKRLVFYLDGIRYSIGMINVAYDRLIETLYSLQTQNWDKQYLRIVTPSAMLDAWSIIDSVHRLRNLLMQVPKLRQNSPELRIFYDKTKDIEDLRNTIQHLRTAAEDFLAKDLPAMGILTWVVLLKPDDKSAWLYSLVAGTTYPNVLYKFVNPLGKVIHSPVDHVTIMLCNHSVCISNVIEQVEQVKFWLEEELKKQLDAEPDFLMRARLTFGKDNSVQTLADYNKTLELKPYALEALNNRGNIYSKAGEHDKALADYNKALKLKPYSPDILNNRGIIYSVLGEHDKAIADYNKALKLKPDFPEVFNNRGMTYLQLEEKDKALADFNKALELKPDYIEALYNRGNIYLKLEKYNESLSDYNAALEFDPDSLGALHNRGLVYSKLGEYDKALVDYNKVIELKSDYPEALNDRGNFYSKTGEYDKALNDYDKAIELKPNHPDALYNRGIVYSKLGKYDEAIADYNKSLEIRPKFPELLYNISCLYSLQGKVDDAIKYLEKSINHNKKFKETAKTDKDFDKIRDDPRFKNSLETA